jgi:Uma2 family endonuclease
MAATTPRTMTIEEFEALDEPGHFDLIKGELIEMAAGTIHGIVASAIDRAIGNFADSRKLGFTLTADPTFVLSVEGRTAVRPDVAFVRRERLLALADPTKIFPAAPDLAVEVVSPTDRSTDVTAKVQAYLEAGTPLVWVVDPEKHTAAGYRPGAPTLFLSESDSLDGGDVLPGFSLPLAGLFEI